GPHRGGSARAAGRRGGSPAARRVGRPGAPVREAPAWAVAAVRARRLAARAAAPRHRGVRVSLRTLAGPPLGTGRRRVCLYSFHIANLFLERPEGMVGGAEVQLKL